MRSPSTTTSAKLVSEFSPVSRWPVTRSFRTSRLAKHSFVCRSVAAKKAEHDGELSTGEWSTRAQVNLRPEPPLR